MRAEPPLRMRVDVVLHPCPRIVGEVIGARRVDALERANRVADHIGVLDVDDRHLRVGVTEGIDAANRLIEHRGPMLGDVRRVIRVGERARECADQTAHRRAQHERITMQHHESGVGVLRSERLEGDRVMGALEGPATPHAPGLQHPQHEVVVPIRRPLIDVEQPTAVGRHVGDRFPTEALEVLAHHRNAFGGSVGVLVMDRLEARVDRVHHRRACARGIDPRAVPKRVGGCRRNRVAGLPTQQRAI